MLDFSEHTSRFLALLPSGEFDAGKKLSGSLWSSGDFGGGDGNNFLYCALFGHYESILANQTLLQDMEQRNFDAALVDLKGNYYGLIFAHLLRLPGI